MFVCHKKTSTNLKYLTLTTGHCIITFTCNNTISFSTMYVVFKFAEWKFIQTLPIFVGIFKECVCEQIDQLDAILSQVLHAFYHVNINGALYNAHNLN